MIIDKEAATRVLVSEAEQSLSGEIDLDWQQAIEKFSRICDASSRTHIAFLGTALLAKSTDVNVDAWAVKAGSKHTGAYSARSLGHGVLVRDAPMLGINLGVTGREPLNNQPYFRIDRVSRSIVVHGNAREALDALCSLLEKLQSSKTADEARRGLRAFIFVRRQWNPVYGGLEGVSQNLTVASLVRLIDGFVAQNSEGGKRAQAIVAGLLDVFAGEDRIETSRVNDPDRHLPGDVGVRSPSSDKIWEKIFEVRDKPVGQSDLYYFAQKACEHGVPEAAVVAVGSGQPLIDLTPVADWALLRGVTLTLFVGWDAFVRQTLFWAPVPSNAGALSLPVHVHKRLVEVEVSQATVDDWVSLAADNHDLNK